MISSFVDRLKKYPDFRDLIVHHEIIPARQAKYGELLPPPHPLLNSLIEQKGWSPLYTHQAEAIRLIRQGHHVICSTPTASGKTLIYNLPVLESILKDPKTHALYMFPLKALEQDQRDELEEITPFLPKLEGGLVTIYDGDTPSYHRQKIKQTPPRIVLTNPDMLHFGILPYHGQ